MLPRECYASARTAKRSGVFIDARTYYKAFAHAALQAKRSIFIAGWEFSSRVELLRGSDREGWEAPTQLAEFLNWLCERNPDLHVYLLGWDYSAFFTMERELFQKIMLDKKTHARVRVVFDSTAPAGASHHIKMVVIDGQLVFSGGIDLTESRWDDSKHRTNDPLRVNANGSQQQPYHDLQCVADGDVAAFLHGMFIERWERATGEKLSIEPCASEEGASSDRFVVNPDVAFAEAPIAISRTDHLLKPPCTEILDLHVHAILAAKELIYAETQYFTSRRLLDAMLARALDSRRPLQVILILPLCASPKENLVLGRAQTQIIGEVSRVFRENGHVFRVFYPGPDVPDGVATYVHSKLLIVDDEFVTVGSANFTNRSMTLDSELNFSWGTCTREPSASSSHPPLGVPQNVQRKMIRDLRVRLLCEHTGCTDGKIFEAIERLAERLDALVHPKSRLRVHPTMIAEPPSTLDPTLRERIFDPEKPLDEMELDELVGTSMTDWISRQFYAGL